MKKGGYKIIDFKGAELSNTIVVRPGIYSQIIDNYDKSILVSGVSLGGSLKDDSFASVSEVTGDSGDSVELGVYGGVIIVTEDDEVSFEVSKSPAELAAEIGDLDDLETTEKGSVVGAINEVVGLIDEVAANNIGSTVDIINYTSAEPYVAQSDGYVVVSSQSSSSGSIRVAVQGANNITGAQIYMNVAGTYQSDSIFVRKGMKVYTVESTVANATVSFKPLF